MGFLTPCLDSCALWTSYQPSLNSSFQISKVGMLSPYLQWVCGFRDGKALSKCRSPTGVRGEDVVVSTAGSRCWQRRLSYFTLRLPVSQSPFRSSGSNGQAVALQLVQMLQFSPCLIHSCASGTSMEISLLLPPKGICVSSINSENCWAPNSPSGDTFSNKTQMIVQLMFSEHLLCVRHSVLCFHASRLTNVTENDYYFTEPSVA